ncbi:hypothetical protein CRG98_003018 [Punica granatum]|uniref:Uncharacterized protein n=1 Tax=Punica granatum TaxID=22663 RepID=A0A2I0L773_PUNGR|nr:hypothetical protein CRG98_003018 [Punica granatum]
MHGRCLNPSNQRDKNVNFSSSDSTQFQNRYTERDEFLLPTLCRTGDEDVVRRNHGLSVRRRFSHCHRRSKLHLPEVVGVLAGKGGRDTAPVTLSRENVWHREVKGDESVSLVGKERRIEVGGSRGRHGRTGEDPSSTMEIFRIIRTKAQWRRMVEKEKKFGEIPIRSLYFLKISEFSLTSRIGRRS